MIVENSESIEIVLDASATTQPSYEVAIAAADGPTYTQASSEYGATNGTTPVTLVTGAASTQKRIIGLHVYNRDNITHTVTIRRSSTQIIKKATLPAGFSLHYSAEKLWQVCDSSSEITSGSPGADGVDGTDGLGWTGGSYNAGTGVVTFTSTDGLGFATGDLRGANGSNGSNGSNGADGADGLGWTGGSYNAGTGVVTFTSDDGLGFTTGDLRGETGAPGTVATPAGPTGAVQFNDAGVIGGSSLVGIENDQLRLEAVSSPVTPAADGISMFGRKVANRILPAFVGPAGLDSSIQPFFARNKIGLWMPPGNATTVPGVLGFTAPTITGFTATARNVATTNLFTRMRRLGYVTATTVGTVGHWRMSIAQFTVGDSTTQLGGFHYIIRFGISDAASVSGARMFMGLRSVATPTNVEPSTLTTCIGIGHGASDTNYKLFYGGSSAQTPIDLGANFPSNTLSTDAYELALFSPPNSGDVHYEVTRLNTGHTASGTITNSGATVLPTNTTLIGPWGYRTNNATALAVGLDVMSAYIETDY